MNQEKRTLVIQDDPTRGEGVTVKGMRIRRCNGCVKCITMNPGRCALEDDFSPVIAQLASHDTVRFVSKVDGNTFPGAVTKAVERISNILQAYTELGGNTPLDTEGVRLNRVEIVAIGEPEDRELFERDLRTSLLMGPVETIVFEYL